MAESFEQMTPRVWVLLGEGVGGNAQMIALAEALGWGYETRQLSWSVLNRLPNPVIGAHAFTLDRHADALRPPWPDLVIAASRRSAPIARWIKTQSGGRTRLVHLLHTQWPLRDFDLVITSAQFRVPEADNVLRTTRPLNVIDARTRAAAAARWQVRLAHLPRPWIGVLVGGSSSSYRFKRRTALALAETANAMARECGGSLLVTTSRRTPSSACRAIKSNLTGPRYFHEWHAGDDDNPYPAFLALADRFLVTGDSASLPAEATGTGAPVTLFQWPPARPPRALPAWLKPLHRALVYRGWYKPRRDFAAFHAGLRRAGLIDRDPPLPPPDDMSRAVAAIRRLMSAPDERGSIVPVSSNGSTS